MRFAARSAAAPPRAPRLRGILAMATFDTDYVSDREPSETRPMKRQPSLKRELVVAVISIGISLAGALDLIGHPARLVNILTIFAGGVGAGVSLGRTVERMRAERRARAAAPVS